MTLENIGFTLFVLGLAVWISSAIVTELKPNCPDLLGSWYWVNDKYEVLRIQPGSPFNRPAVYSTDLGFPLRIDNIYSLKADYWKP